MIRFIAAIDKNRGIADDGGIPWQGKLPTDVAYFRDKTLNGVVMMGQGWYEEQEKPLPQRRNLVASRHLERVRPGFELITDAREFLQTTTDDIWVGGGAGLFEATLDLADELYLTLIDEDFHCSKFFPEYEHKFACVERSPVQSENGIHFCFTVWRRKES